QGLLVAVGLADGEARALTAAIADFRDADDETHLGGAEDAEYRAAGLAWGPKNKPFEAVEELHQVLGMTRQVYALAAPGLTVHSRSKGVDVTVAPAIVLLALPGVDAEAVEAFTEQRQARPGAGEQGAGQMAGAELGGARITTLPGLGRQYASRSRGRVFTVRAEARVRSGAVFVREAVISMTRNIEKPFNIHAWRRGRRASPGPE
ncbi:MAG: general secretion pathway protein GspK, partial [Proteobacteria bacterium]|nr:general secretion pathway protein GspK [Pseudomonadota bacterium]